MRSSVGSGIPPAGPRGAAPGGIAGAAALQALLLAAQEHHRQGRPREAEADCRHVLSLVPEHPGALGLLGRLAVEAGRLADAASLFRRAAAAAPEVAAFAIDLGSVEKLRGRLDEAEAAYRRAVALDPRSVLAQVNLGTVLKDLGRLEEARAVLERCLAGRPDCAPAHYVLGNVLERQGLTDEAAAAYRATLAHDPNFTRAYELQSRSLHRAGKYREAEGLLRHWLRLEPGHPAALHMLAACTGESPTPTADAGYVRWLFDEFAPTFDATLGRIGYRGPALVMAALAPDLGPAAGRLDILDAGCGTGLCGPLLRPHARRLVGVDLSPAMLAEARGRGLYDALVEAELTAYLGGCGPVHDIVVAADVLIYFGVLEPLFAALAQALRPGGLAALTMERLADDAGSPGFRLNPHGRYGHAETYARAALAAAGLEVVRVETGVLREEFGSPVEGLVVVARRPGGG